MQRPPLPETDPRAVAAFEEVAAEDKAKREFGEELRDELTRLRKRRSALDAALENLHTPDDAA